MAQDLSTGYLNQSTYPPVLHLHENCDLTPEDCDALRIIKKTTVSLSISADVVTLAVCMLFRMHQTFDQRVFVYILVSNLVEGVSFCLTDGREDGTWCVIQGYLITTLGVTQFLWVASLTFYLFLVFTKRKSKADVDRKEWLFICICWVLPAAISTLPLITDDYGLASMPYCWLRSGSGTSNIWRFAIYWIPIIVGNFLIMSCFIYLHAYVMRMSNIDDLKNEIRFQLEICERLRPLKYYGVSFVALHIIQVINRLQNIKGEPLTGLVGAHVFCHCIYGLVLCTLFFILNGRKAFNWNRFQQSVQIHRDNFLCLKRSDVEEINGVVGEITVTPATSPEMQRRSTIDMKVY